MVAMIPKVDLLACCCGVCWLVILALFVLIAGWPGLLHIDEFETFYDKSTN